MSRAVVVGWLVSAAVVMGAISCARGDLGGRAAGDASKAGQASSLPGDSIYNLDLSLIDDTGRSMNLADLRGQTLVAAMMYTSCTSVCPRVVDDMKRVERELTGKNLQNIRFVLFSLDPGRDTPQAMRTFAAEHGLDGSRWRSFAASEDGVRDLSAVLGVKYVREESGDIAHSAMIFVIDADGVVVQRQIGLSKSPGALIDALARTRR